MSKIFLSYEVFDNLTSDSFSEDALELFIHLDFRAGKDYKIYTNASLLCDLVKQRSKVILMHDLRQMEAYNYITLSTPNKRGYFWITLEYEAFVPKNNFFIITSEEFECVASNQYLLRLLCGIKKYRCLNTNISFSSYSTIAEAGGISSSTVTRRLKDLEPILHIQPYTIKLADSTVIKRNFYKSKSDGELTYEEVADIVADYYPNATILHS